MVRGNRVSIEESGKPSEYTGFEAAELATKIEYGETFNENIMYDAYNKVLPSLQNYGQFKDQYDSVANMHKQNSFGMDVSNQYALIVDIAQRKDFFVLDENDNMIPGPKHNPRFDKWSKQDKDLLQGLLLVDKYKPDVNTEARNMVYKYRDEIARANPNWYQSLGGSVKAYFDNPEIVAMDVIASYFTGGASMTGSMAKNIGLAYGKEALAVLPSELHLDAQKRKFANIMGERRDLIDTVLDYSIAAFTAGTLRAAGSLTYDWNVHRQISKDLPPETRQAVFERFMGMKEKSLNTNFYADEYTFAKALKDIESGKTVDVQDMTDIDINTKTDPNIEEVNIFDEVQKQPEVQAEMNDIETTSKKLDEEVQVAPETSKKQSIDELDVEEQKLFDEMYNDPRFKDDVQELEDIQNKQETDAQLKEYYDSMDAMYADIEKMQGTQFKSKIMTFQNEEINKTDFDLIQSYFKTREWNRNNPTRKRNISTEQQDAYNRHTNIADALKDIEFTADNSMDSFKDFNLFAKYADNLGAGFAAGIEQDDQGNITFNPEKFLMGLGGYTAMKKMYKAGVFNQLPEAVNAVVKKYTGVDINPMIVEQAQTMFRGDVSETLSVVNSKGGNFGKGLYFTDNLGVVQKLYNNGKIYKVDIKGGKFLDTDNLEEASKVYNEFLKENGYEEQPFTVANHNTYKIVAGMAKDTSFNDWLKNKGYDGIIGTSIATGRQKVIFEDSSMLKVEVIPQPGQIKADTVEAILEKASKLEGKAQQNMLNNIDMRKLTPEDKAKVIEFRKANSKPKLTKEKAEEVILAKGHIGQGIYSKLEDVSLKIPDNMTFKTKDELEAYLKKQGVKQDELDGSDILNELPLDSEIDKTAILNKVKNRRDKVFIENVDDFNSRMMEQDEFEEYNDITEGVTFRHSDSGEATVISNSHSGYDVHIATKYDDEVYVDGDNYVVGDYYEMQQTWYDNFYDGEYDDIVKEKFGVDDLNKVEAGEVKDAVLDAAEDDAPWYEYYNTQVKYFIDETGEEFDTMDEAIDAAKDELWGHYSDYHNDMEHQNFESYTVYGGYDYKMETFSMPDATQYGKSTHEEPHLTDMIDNYEGLNENVAFHIRSKTRSDITGKEGTVIEEIQSQWEQDWRKQGGGQKPRTQEEQAVLDAKLKEAETARDEAYNLYMDKKKENNGLIIDLRNRLDEIEANRYNTTNIYSEYLNLAKQRKELYSRITNENAANGTFSEKDILSNPDYQKALDAAEAKYNEYETAKAFYSTDPEIRTISQQITKLENETRTLLDNLRLKDTEARTAEERAKINIPRVNTPPIQNRTQYERLALFYKLKDAVDADQDFFGWINGHIQNGDRIRTTEGMVQAYDREMPRIIQKITGETPYMATFNHGTPIAKDPNMPIGKDNAIFWDAELVKDPEYFDKLAGDTKEWYWKIDLTPELKEKLKKARIQLYSVGGAGLAVGYLQDGEENK